MLREHDKLPDEVARQDPDFIDEYRALLEAEAQIAGEGKGAESSEDARTRGLKAKGAAIRQRHKTIQKELTVH